MSENLKNLKEKIDQKSALCSTHSPLDKWPGALDHLAIGLVDDKYTKLWKIGEKELFILGLAPSITDGVHRNENLVAIIPVFSTFSNFFKKKK